MRISESILITVLLVLFFFYTGNSQSKLTFGVEAGINVANVSVDNQPPGTDNSSITGPIVGAVLETGIDETFSLLPGFRYVVKGSKESGTNNNVPYNAKLTLNYLEVPLLLKINFPSGILSPHLNLGPVFGFNTAAEVDYEQGSGQNYYRLVADVGNQIEALDISFNLGGGLDYELTDHAILVLNANYSLGLTDVTKTGPSSTTTNGIQLTTGIRFH